VWLANAELMLVGGFAVVLPKAQLDIVQQLTHVEKNGGLVENGVGGPGLSALFVGPSGTGKALAAGLLVNELDHDDRSRINFT